MRRLTALVVPMLWTLTGCAVNWGGETPAPMDEYGPAVERTGSPEESVPGEGPGESFLALPRTGTVHTKAEALQQLGLAQSYAGYDRAGRRGAIIKAMTRAPLPGRLADLPITGGLEVCQGRPVAVQTSSLHCGRCEHSCLGGGCNAGRCEPMVMAADIYGLGGMALIGGEVVYAEAGGIFQVSHEGHYTSEIGPRSSGAVEVAVDTASVFFLDRAGIIVRTDKKTNESKPLFATKEVTRGLTLQENFLFWVGRDASLSDRIMSGRVGEAAPQLIVDTGARVRSVAYGPDHVYYATDDGRIMRASRVEGCSGSSCVAEIAAGQYGAASIAVTKSHVFWGNEIDGSIKAASLVDGNVTRVTSAQGAPMNLTADQDGVYYSVRRYGGATELTYLANATATPVVVASHAGDVSALKSDELAVYWASVGTGAIYRLAK